MALTVTQSATAIAPRCPASFLALGGTAPYLYSVAAGGAGGTINPTTGAYIGPLGFKSSPFTNIDTIIIDDALGATARASILIGSPLILFCDILSHELNIPRNRVYLWDQKIMQPTDFGLYVAVSVASAKPFGNSSSFRGSDDVSDQFVSMMTTLDLDIISRGPDARDRKEEIILALNSIYSQQQQNTNSFFVGTLSTRFINLSEIDGAAIPYRFRISVNMQYFYQKQTTAPYFDNFSDAAVVENS